MAWPLPDLGQFRKRITIGRTTRKDRDMRIKKRWFDSPILAERIALAGLILSVAALVGKLAIILNSQPPQSPSSGSRNPGE